MCMCMCMCMCLCMCVCVTRTRGVCRPRGYATVRPHGVARPRGYRQVRPHRVWPHGVCRPRGYATVRPHGVCRPRGYGQVRPHRVCPHERGCSPGSISEACGRQKWPFRFDKTTTFAQRTATRAQNTHFGELGRIVQSFKLVGGTLRKPKKPKGQGIQPKKALGKPKTPKKSKVQEPCL